MKAFYPVKSGKVSELIVRQIKRTILNGRMEPGDKLPPERELVQRFQASRISVREALKNLETAGLLMIKPGSGVFVAEANSKPLSDSLSSILRMQKASINDLTEARIIVEPSIAKLASERISREELTKLEKNIHETLSIVKSDLPSPSQNIEFHSLIAEATHNPVIALSMKTLFDVVKEMTLEMKDNLPKRIEISSHAVDFHKKILNALREKNSQKVHDLMFKHILQIQEGLKKAKSKTE
jgi:GntR family transcriptional repressor for pyruvate dehydrogenase complex